MHISKTSALSITKTTIKTSTITEKNCSDTKLTKVRKINGKQVTLMMMTVKHSKHTTNTGRHANWTKPVSHGTEKMQWDTTKITEILFLRSPSVKLQ